MNPLLVVASRGPCGGVGGFGYGSSLDFEHISTSNVIGILLLCFVSRLFSLSTSSVPPHLPGRIADGGTDGAESTYVLTSLPALIHNAQAHEGQNSIKAI
jgi:hypothetical protein